MKPTIVAFSISTLEPVLREVSLDLLPEADIEIVPKAYEEALVYAQRRHQAGTADVFIAAGSNGAYLKDQLNAPLVLITVDGFDLMRCLADARGISSRVGLVTYAKPYLEVEALAKAYGIPLQTRTYRTPDEARRAVRELVAERCEVIVGPGLVNGLAAEYGVEHLLSYSQGSVRRAFNEAIKLGRVQRNVLSAGAPLKSAPKPRQSAETLLGQSKAMQEVRQLIQWYAPTDGSVFIQGQTGTGKELVAQAIHAQSGRAGRSFIALNCAALTESLLESELFGYEEGAFSGAAKGGRAGIFEAGHMGTVFLDEIGDMPLQFQSRLLRVLEERVVRRVGSTRTRDAQFRLITATHVNLQQRMLAGLFREDLYYRINELRLELPSLTQRPEDLALLAEYFLVTADTTLDSQRRRLFIDQALPLFESHTWPGNVRELRQLCKRAAVFLRQSQPVSARQILKWLPELERSVCDMYSASSTYARSASEHASVEPKALQRNMPDATVEIPVSASPPRGKVGQTAKPRKHLSQSAVQSALSNNGGNVSAAAQELGIGRTTLWRLMKRLAG